MERDRKYWNAIMAAMGLMLLIFDSNRALEGAADGMELCLKTVIPTLFPFFVLSMLLTSSFGTGNSKMIKGLAKYLPIPPAASSVLIPAVLGGYPVGAKCAGDLYHRKQISKMEAERLLYFCNNAGPSFLFGMISGFFPEKKLVWLLWGIHLTSAVLTALIMPAEALEESDMVPAARSERTEIILSAAKAMCLVCCWVILFRILITFLKAWFLWMLPVWMQVLLMGILELTNGCCALLLITDIRLRFVLCSCMLAFGGICVILQTASVTQGLSLRNYWKGKTMQTVFSLLLSCAIIMGQVLILAGFLPVFVFIVRKIQKRYRNPRLIPV